MLALNLGCNAFKFKGFVNIDIDPDFNPDLILDITKLDEAFEPNSVDFIYAGHILEHLSWDEAVMVMRKANHVLKMYGTVLVVVPDYTKIPEDTPIEIAEQIIFDHGRHKILFNEERLDRLFYSSGFFCYSKWELSKIPYVIVSNSDNPEADPWQSAFMGSKQPTDMWLT